MRRLALPSLALAFLLPLAGCDKLGIDTPATIAARKDADAKAVGGACRNALRAIEDCYTLNPKANKAAVYAGWMEMDQYMRDNKLEGTAPVVPRGGASGAPSTAEDADGASAADSAPADKPAEKAPEKTPEKAPAKPAEKSKSH
jgi:hypothetical protein